MLELRRNVIFGQYFDTGSVLHRLDPRIKLALASLLIVAFLVMPGWVGFVVIFPVIVVGQILSRIPLGYLLRGSRYFLFFLALILAFTVLFTPSSSGVLWHWSILAVSVPGLRSAGVLAARVILLYWTTTMLMLCTAMVDLADAVELVFSPLQRVRVPVNELVLVGVIAFKFVPIFTDEAERIIRARTARGLPMDGGGPIRRARRLTALLIPIFISGFQRAELLTVAMEARCYRGGQSRTKLRRMESSGIDWLVLVIVLSWVVGSTWFSIHVA